MNRRYAPIEGSWYGPVDRMVALEASDRRRREVPRRLAEILLVFVAIVASVGLVRFAVDHMHRTPLLACAAGLAVVELLRRYGVEAIPEPRTRAIVATKDDLALLESDSDPNVFLVQARVRFNNLNVGVDRGLVWVEDGAIRFFGQCCDFCIPREDWTVDVMAAEGVPLGIHIRDRNLSGFWDLEIEELLASASSKPRIYEFNRLLQKTSAAVVLFGVDPKMPPCYSQVSV